MKGIHPFARRFIVSVILLFIILGMGFVIGLHNNAIPSSLLLITNANAIQGISRSGDVLIINGSGERLKLCFRQGGIRSCQLIDGFLVVTVPDSRVEYYWERLIQNP